VPTRQVGTFDPADRARRDAQSGTVLIDEGLELLTEAESLELLARADVGRVGVTIGALPAIFPVNYRMIDGAVVFRTGAGSKLRAATSEAVVAFEIDGYDRDARSGWSVLVVGRAEVVRDPELAEKVLASGLEPFAGGDRSAIVRIEPGFVSGRRIALHGQATPSAERRCHGH